MKDTHVQWATDTFNPWIGCTKVDELCDHCYAETRDIRFAGGAHWGVGAPRQRTGASNWNQTRRWNREDAVDGKPRRVFCASLADVFDLEIPVEWFADLMHLIDECRNLEFLLLTKRPGVWRRRIEQCIREALAGGEFGPRHMLDEWLAGNSPANVWMGTSVGHQKSADVRIPRLLEIPAKIHFLSCEPLLGPVDLGPAFNGTCSGRVVEWVICGGESGAGARPMELEWANSLRDQCAKATVPFFMKQLGGNPNKRGDVEDFLLNLRVRELPKI